MTPGSADDWPRVNALLDAALDLPPAERAAMLTAACGDDSALRARVDEMLAACDVVESALERPAAQVAAGLIADVEDADADAMVGRRLGPYRLVRALGEGGMGSVYLAERADDQYRKQVAVKLIRSGFASTDLRRRFRNERQILATLEHPNVARLLDGGVTDETFGAGLAGLPYLVMEYVAGEPLDRYCDRRALTVADRVRLFGEVCAAVQHAHARGIVHRDLKPSNILVTESAGGTGPAATVKLLDFGIAKLLDDGGAPEGTAGPLTRTGMQLMTVEYASPEQIRGELVTPASDVYALGVVLYELLAGRRPYMLTTRSPTEIQRVILDAEPDRPSAPPTTEPRCRAIRGDLDTIVLKALRKEPERRYESADALRLDLERYLTGEPITARSGAWTYRATKLARRHRVVAVSAAAVLLIAGAFFALYTVRLNRALSVLPGADQRVLLGEFASANGDSLLAAAVTEALRIDLAHSATARVLEPSQVSAVLKRMNKPATTRLVPEVARELALRDAVPAVIVGDVARAGTGYLLTARIVATESGDALAVARETARDSTAVIDAIDHLSKQLRGSLGESLRRVRSAPDLAHATTGSLEALQLYTQGAVAIERDGDFPRAIPLLERAIALDSNFASAYYALASALNNTRTDPARRIAALQRAFTLRERLTTREQHSLAASYYRLVGNLEGAIAEYRAAIDVTRPDEPIRGGLHNNLGLVYQQRRDFGRAEEAFRTAIAIDSTGVAIPYMNLQGVLVASGRFADAERVIAAMARLFPKAPFAPIARASYAGVRGDLAAAEREVRGLLATFGSSPVWKVPASRMLAHALVLQGRLAEGEGALADAAELSASKANVTGYFGATLDRAALDLFVRHDTARATARVDSALRRFPLASQPVSGRPYLSLALWYALVGNARRASAFLAEYEANELPEIRQGAGRMVHVAQGAVALAEGRSEEAVRLLREADTEGCTTCVLPLLGAALEKAGDAAGARAVYDRYLTLTWFDRAVPWPSSAWEASGDALWRARVQERRARL